MLGGTTETYAYSSTANQVTTITTTSNTRSFSYLASGQVSQDVRDSSDTYTFAANNNGRNASAALNGTTAGAYLYNAFEQRVQGAVRVTFKVVIAPQAVTGDRIGSSKARDAIIHRDRPEAW